MKKTLVTVNAVAFVFATASFAMAAPPTVIDTDGGSKWSYDDTVDTSAKREGAYKAFDNAGPGTYNNPHGGFDSTTNKCKVCHAVHRAEGAYYLLRADTQDDACDYCHIGGSAHSVKTVYSEAGTTAAANGHTIGASATIPDSSVNQWLTDVTLTTTDALGNEVTETVKVRSYSETRNQMFRFAKHHGHSKVGTGRNGYQRIGPLALRCMNCHQPHNAKNMIWNPQDFYSTGSKLTTGYKLLRSMPSASIRGTATQDGVPVNYDQGMQELKSYTSYDPAAGHFTVNAANVVKVPETTLSAGSVAEIAEGWTTNTGTGFTIYTGYTGEMNMEDDHKTVQDRYPQFINQYALSPWCADCHNLNIGYWKHLTHEELGFKSHADRTHPVPYTGAYNGSAQCYSCHRNDLPNTMGGSNPNAFFNSGRNSCEECHFSTGSYARVMDPNDDKSSAGVDTGYDFPHSGKSTSIKLLGPWSAVMGSDDNSRVVTNTVAITENNLDAVCMRCHTGVGTNH